MLSVQEFLLTHSTSELYETHGVEASFSKDRTLMSLNYSQINSKENDKLACQCRGLILARKDGKPITDGVFGESVIACYGFDRFFNEGQDCAKVNYKDPNLKVYEKLDGTCIFLYHYNGWKIATRSCPIADIMIDDDYDFSSLFKKSLVDTIGLSFEDYVKTLDKNCTYQFELTSPRNMIVVRYNDYRVTLLAVRDKTTFKEFEIETLDNLVPKVGFYPLSSLDKIVEFVQSRKASEHEGVVVRDSQFRRVKIKNVEYLALNRIRDRLGKSERSMLELILMEKEDDAAAYLPDELVTKLYDMKAKVSILLRRIDANYKAYIAEVDLYPYSKQVRKRVFAEFVSLRERFTDPFFKIYDGKAKDVMDYVKKKQLPSGGWQDNFLDKMIDCL